VKLEPLAELDWEAFTPIYEKLVKINNGVAQEVFGLETDWGEVALKTELGMAVHHDPHTA